MIAINLTGVFKTVKAAAPHLIERQTGSIVLISSVDGFEPAWTTSTTPPPGTACSA